MPVSADDPTPVSLLKKLRQSSAARAQESWRRFVNLYTPLLFLWARRLGAGAGADDAEELVQDVFTTLAREMPTFQHDPGRRFRGWLWTLVQNRWRDELRHRDAGPSFAGAAGLEAVAAPDNVEEFAEEEYRTYLIRRALEVLQAELPAQEWQACREYVLRGRPAAAVAQELGLSVNQVYLAKSRGLRRVRAELEGLLD